MIHIHEIQTHCQNITSSSLDPHAKPQYKISSESVAAKKLTNRQTPVTSRPSLAKVISTGHTDTDRVDASSRMCMGNSLILHDGSQQRQLVPDFDDLLQLVVIFNDDNDTLGSGGN